MNLHGFQNGLTNRHSGIEGTKGVLENNLDIFSNGTQCGLVQLQQISVIKNKGAIWVLKGQAFVDSTLVSEAELKAMIVDK